MMTKICCCRLCTAILGSEHFCCSRYVSSSVLADALNLLALNYITLLATQHVIRSCFAFKHKSALCLNVTVSNSMHMQAVLSFLVVLCLQSTNGGILLASSLHRDLLLWRYKLHFMAATLVDCQAFCALAVDQVSRVIVTSAFDLHKLVSMLHLTWQPLVCDTH